MILLDPDLDPHLAPAATSAKTAAVPALEAIPRKHRLPSTRTLARFLGEAQAAVRLKGQVTALLTTDAALRRLNRQFRGKNKATDVLSFPAEGIGAEEMAGDLAISVPTALRQALEQGHTLSTEIKVLLLHGLLHLAGYDHETDEGQMARRERLLRGRLGLPQGLIERAGAETSGKPLSGAKQAAEKLHVPPNPPHLVTGHDFSRAANVIKSTRSLAPEGCSSPLAPESSTSSAARKARLQSKPSTRGLKP